jgi:hypothetical protein
MRRNSARWMKSAFRFRGYLAGALNSSNNATKSSNGSSFGSSGFGVTGDAKGTIGDSSLLILFLFLFCSTAGFSGQCSDTVRTLRV